MLNIDRALDDDRLIKAITGLSKYEFNELIESFREEFQNETLIRYEIVTCTISCSKSVLLCLWHWLPIVVL